LVVLSACTTDSNNSNMNAMAGSGVLPTAGQQAAGATAGVMPLAGASAGVMSTAGATPIAGMPASGTGGVAGTIAGSAGTTAATGGMAGTMPSTDGAAPMDDAAMTEDSGSNVQALPPVTDYTEPGPFDTTMTANQGPGSKYTIFRPEPL